MPREAVGITMPASHVMSLDIFAIDRTMIAGQRGEGLGHEAPYPRSERLWQFPALVGHPQVPTYETYSPYHGNNKIAFGAHVVSLPSTIDQRPCQPYKVTLEQHSYASLHLTSPLLSSSTAKPCSPAITTHK